MEAKRFIVMNGEPVAILKETLSDKKVKIIGVADTDCDAVIVEAQERDLITICKKMCGVYEPINE